MIKFSVLVLAIVVALASSADASTVHTSRLVIKSSPSGKNKLVFKSARELAVSSGSYGSDGDPRCAGAGGGGGSIRVNGGGANDFTIDLPCEGWITTNGSPANVFNTDYTYRDPSGATCDRIIVKHGKTIKAICRGPQVAYVLGAAQGDIDVTLRLGSLPVLNCATIGPPPTKIIRDGSNGRTYVAKDAPDPVSCSSP